MSDEVLDVAEFKERVQDDIELLLELLDIYSTDLKEKRPKIQEAVESGNADEVRALAHSLKGSSGNISAKALRETFMQLEEKGKVGDLTGAEDLVTEIDTKFATLEERIVSVKAELQ